MAQIWASKDESETQIKVVLKFFLPSAGFLSKKVCPILVVVVVVASFVGKSKVSLSLSRPRIVIIGLGGDCYYFCYRFSIGQVNNLNVANKLSLVYARLPPEERPRRGVETK